jgi:hypothetical protein
MLFAALSHGVIIKQQNLRKTISDITTLLQNCESENTILKSDNASLIQQVKNLNTTKGNLEKELSRYRHSDINVD